MKKRTGLLLRKGPGPLHFLILLLAVSLAYRLVLALNHANYLGVDGGAYLISVNYVLGDEPTGAGFPRPPLAPGWLLVPFIEFWGVDTGYKIWSSVSAILPIIPVYLISRRLLSPWTALIPTAIFSVDLWQSEMFVTGALPLIGFTLIATAVWCIWELVDPKRFNWCLMGLLAFCVALTPWINQTSAGLIVIIVLVFFFACAFFMSRSSVAAWLRLLTAPWAFLPVTVSLVVGGIFALAALPWYLDIAPGSKLLHYPGSWIYFTHLRDSPWLQLVFAAPVAILAIRKGHTPQIKALGSLVLLLSILALLLSTDETVINIFYRSRYIMGLFAWPLIAWVVFKYLSWNRAGNVMVYGAATGLFLSLVFGFYHTFNQQSDYSDMVTVETVKALDYLKVTAPRNGVITNSFGLSLWVSGLNKVKTPHVWTWEPPRAYTETDKQVRCVLGWIDGCNVFDSTEKLAVAYVLVDERWPYYNERAPSNYGAPDNQWDVTAAAPWLNLVYSEGSTRLWEIK